MRGVIQEPMGLAYQADFIDADYEKQLLNFLSGLELEDVTIRGNTAKRTVRHFGLRYDYGSHTIKEGESIPIQFNPLIDKAERFAELKEGTIVEALINKYPYGAAIGWHNDAPVYDVIIGISLRAPCIIQFQREDHGEKLVFEKLLNPRSAYIMRDEVHKFWKHQIPAIKSERYSITFRSLRKNS